MFYIAILLVSQLPPQSSLKDDLPPQVSVCKECKVKKDVKIKKISCGCSSLCTCGCQQGDPCRCATTSLTTPVVPTYTPINYPAHITNPIPTANPTYTPTYTPQPTPTYTPRQQLFNFGPAPRWGSGYTTRPYMNNVTSNRSC